jgi:hypothetical protein
MTLVGYTATDESLARLRRSRLEALPRRAARARLRAGLGTTAFDVRTAVLALSGLEGEERRWMLETILVWKRGTRRKSPREVLLSALYPKIVRLAAPLASVHSVEIERLMEQRELLSGHGSRRVTSRGSSDASVLPSSTGESHHYFGVDEAIKYELITQEGVSVREHSQGRVLSGPRLPYSREELLEAIKARRHRTEDQELMVDFLRIYLADRKPASKLLADALGCGLRTIERYRHEGAVMLGSVRAETRDEKDRHLHEILTALGIEA